MILEGRCISPRSHELLNGTGCVSSTLYPAQPAPQLCTWQGLSTGPPALRPQQKYPQPHSSPSPRGTQFPGRGWRGLHLHRGCAPRCCARKGVSWLLGLQGASPGPRAWGDSPWNHLWSPVGLLPQLSAPRLEARAASGQLASLLMDPPRGMGWSPRPICRAVYDTRVSQEAWLAFSGLFVLLNFISAYFLHFKKMCSRYFYNWGKTQNESFHILELKPP